MTWSLDEPGVLALPSGRLLRGRRWTTTVKNPPDLGLYALWRDPTPDWPYRWIRWPDFGLPIHGKAAWTTIEQTWQAAESQRIEVACGGGKGRTGTILAAMAILEGLSADDAIAWVRTHYDQHAVETPWQRTWLQHRRDPR
ncbi:MULTISPECIES: protein-tyrosine phosphatase family protein [unclassified Luteococcus]|uniref:protein-tyrosine phosphatase family protein n=2 Tax=unclassified Luteococcus TaxID=2639923 RepID=UPI00313B6189